MGTSSRDKRPLAGRAEAHRGSRPSTSLVSPINSFLRLQQTVGNQAVQRLLESGSIKAKLRVSRPADSDEMEADRVAEQVTNSSSPTRVHRKCSCATGGGTCSKCHAGEEPVIQRHAGSGIDVSGTLANNFSSELGSGRALDPSLREDMESRFGHDFREVRIHTDSEAADSARAVNARAYTLGSDVVFDSGEYAPHSHGGKQLLAHELVHVVQQRGPRQVSLQRQDAKTPKPKDPTLSAGNMKHKKLSDADKKKIAAAFTDAPAAPATVAAFKDGPRFVLHDTGTRPISKGKSAAEKADDLEKKETARIDELAKIGGTPVGEGPSAYVTGKGTPKIAHPKFFETDRPTATEFERGNDLMTKKDRETNFQKIWSLSDPKVQTDSIAKYLTRFTLTKDQVKKETDQAKQNLDSKQSTPNDNPKTPAVLTTGTGAARIICDRVVAAKSAKGISVSGKEQDLETACGGVTTLFETRANRIAGSTNIEISADEGSDCRTGKHPKTGENPEPFPGYPAAAYDAVAKLYLLASLEIGLFPEITTHFFLDTSPITTSINRCDPRCLDLERLYAKIAATLGHAKGSTYGVNFKPGTKWGTSTIWWFDPVCGAKPGTPAPSAPKKQVDVPTELPGDPKPPVPKPPEKPPLPVS